jgi:heme exporter protein A
MPRVERIVVAGVSRLFGPTVALRGVDVTFEPGSVTLLEGPNGAGKSTLLAVVGTLLRPSRGRVVYEPLGEDRDEIRAHLGWVAHDAQCYRELTGRENVELGARLHGVDPESGWRAVAERVGAGEFGARRFGTLSRGQRQRIALARALVHRPSVLLLDEPWSGLDAASAAQLEDVVREERDRGAIIVIVSHDASLVERVGGRRIRLERGRIVTAAAPRVSALGSGE